MEQRTWLWRKHSSKTKTLKALKQQAERGEELEKSLRCLSEKLTTLLTESDAKDSLLIKQENVAEEALAGWEKAEANAASLKEELDEALRQTDAAEERLQELDRSLKECMQQLRTVQEERENMIDDFRAKSSREEERVQNLEERLGERNDAIGKLIAERNSLNAVVQTKEKMIKNLEEEKLQVEENCRMLSAKLDASEKQNGSLKYEVYMLGKELEIRNEEKDFNLKSVKAAHKQHLSSVKKITELEEECNKLRVMLRKRLPGPAAIAKMKNEVEMLDAKAKASSSSPAKKKSSPKKSGAAGKTTDAYKRDLLLLEKMQEMDAENKILKEELTRKNGDLQSSLLRCARTASKLSQTEKQLDELSKSSAASLSSDVHGCNDDVLSSSESWASAFVAEPEHFRNGKRMASTGISDINLMDDFIEMEKLASTSASNRYDGDSEPMPISDPDLHLEREKIGAIAILEETCRVALGNGKPEISTSQELKTEMDKAILELIAVVEDIKQISLIDHVDEKAIPEKDSSVPIPREEKSAVDGAEFATWSFRWRSLELKENLESFLHVCDGLLHGNVGIGKFLGEVAATINWVVDHSTRGPRSPIDGKEARSGVETDKSAVPEEVKLTIEVPPVTPDLETTTHQEEKSVASDKRIDGHENGDDLVHSEPQSKRFNASQEFVKTNHHSLSLQIELERLKEAKGLMGHHHPHEHTMCSGEHSDYSQIPTSISDSRKILHGFPSLRETLESASNHPEGSPGACKDLDIQLGSVGDEEKTDVFIDQDQGQLRTNWEISVASEKLTECQETIQNIEKQLKALAASGNSTPPPENSKSSAAPTRIRHRLGDQLLIDNASEKTRADMQLIPRTSSSSTDQIGLLYGMKLSNTHSTLNQIIANGSQAMQAAKSPVPIDATINNNADKSKNAGAGNALAIVPRKQRPRLSFWRVLLRKKARRVVGS